MNTMRKRFWMLAVILGFGFVHKIQATVLDQAKIHHDYEEGNFDAVTHSLEAFLATNPTHTKQDSVFVAKHLAVVYSANPETREKGKYYMYRLLEMLPSAKLVDMFVSDEIDRIFDKIREEFAYRQKSFGVDSSQLQSPKQAPATIENNGNHPQSNAVGVASNSQPAKTSGVPEKGSKKNWTPYLIVAGATGVVVIGVTAYMLTSNDATPEDKVLVIPQ